MGIAAAIAATGNRGGTLGLTSRAPGDHANHCKGGLFQQLVLPLWITHNPQARMRVVEHRGVSSAAMLYDHLPIIDVFRRLDAHTLLEGDGREGNIPALLLYPAARGGSADASQASSLPKI